MYAAHAVKYRGVARDAALREIAEFGFWPLSLEKLSGVPLCIERAVLAHADPYKTIQAFYTAVNSNDLALAGSYLAHEAVWSAMQNWDACRGLRSQFPSA